MDRQTEEDARDLDMWRYENLRTADKSLDERMNTRMKERLYGFIIQSSKSSVSNSIDYIYCPSLYSI